jgi:hypothetical protein
MPQRLDPFGRGLVLLVAVAKMRRIPAAPREKLSGLADGILCVLSSDHATKAHSRKPFDDGRPEPIVRLMHENGPMYGRPRIA